MIKSEIEIIKKWKNQNIPLVSISCITYNQDKYISETITKFLQQETDFPFEILINDDASTDNTAKIIKQFHKKYPNIIVPIFQNENQYSKGIKPHLLNFEKARGHYIALCDGDDYWTDNKKLQTQVNIMRDYNNCDISFHGVNIINLKTKKNKIKLIRSQITKFNSNSIILFDHRIYTSVVSFMITKELKDKLPKFFKSTPTLDYYLIILGSISSGAVYIPKVMANYRLYSDGSWHDSQKSSIQYKLNIKSLIKLKEYLKYSYFSVIGLKIFEFFIKYLIMKVLKN